MDLGIITGQLKLNCVVIRILNVEQGTYMSTQNNTEPFSNMPTNQIIDIQPLNCSF
jgi:hypothetical protein